MVGDRATDGVHGISRWWRRREGKGFRDATGTSMYRYTRYLVNTSRSYIRRFLVDGGGIRLLVDL